MAVFLPAEERWIRLYQCRISSPKKGLEIRPQDSADLISHNTYMYKKILCCFHANRCLHGSYRPSPETLKLVEGHVEYFFWVSELEELEFEGHEHKFQELLSDTGVRVQYSEMGDFVSGSMRGVSSTCMSNKDILVNHTPFQARRRSAADSRHGLESQRESLWM